MQNSISLTSTNIDRIYEQDATIFIGMLSNIIEEFSSFHVRFLIYFRWYLSEDSHVIKLSERECENHKKKVYDFHDEWLQLPQSAFSTPTMTFTN